MSVCVLCVGVVRICVYVCGGSVAPTHVQGIMHTQTGCLCVHVPLCMCRYMHVSVCMFVYVCVRARVCMCACTFSCASVLPRDRGWRRDCQEGELKASRSFPCRALRKGAEAFDQEFLPAVQRAGVESVSRLLVREPLKPYTVREFARQGGIPGSEELQAAGSKVNPCPFRSRWSSLRTLERNRTWEGVTEARDNFFIL